MALNGSGSSNNATDMPTDSLKTSNASTENAPAWLNAALIQKALRTGGGGDASARVKGVAISIATAPGDNYASVIYRVRVELADGAGERSLLVKTAPEGEAVVAAVVDGGLFKTEIAMLSTHVPAMKALLDQASPGRFPPLAARCLLHGASPAPFLVLEDLKPQGFRLAERQRGLGLRHCLLALRTLARFHAASAKLLRANPTLADEFPNPYRTAEDTWDELTLSATQMTADVCKKWPGYEEYAEILERLKPKAMELLTNMNDSDPGKFNVFIHGDFWTNNMMFQYDENGKLNDFRMVDLQVAYVASPVIDILYFLNTSVSEEVSERHEALLIREYHTALIETLNLFGISGPSFKQLMADIHECSLIGVYSMLSMLPIARAEKALDLNASLTGDSSSIASMYESADIKRWLQRVLPEFKRRGWLNY